MEKSQKFHLIGLGNSQMPDLALALQMAGHSVTGSDDHFSTGASEKLQKNNLMPLKAGWFPENITKDLNKIILSPTVTAGNAELSRAQELNLPIISFAEYIYLHSQDKQRVVIVGSYGKTMITALIMHVLHFHGRKFDYLVSANVPGFDTQLRLSMAPLIVIDSQDARASVLDKTPSFLKYQHHIGVIPGIEWQPSDSYPTKEEYISQFRQFGASTPKGGVLVYFELDSVVAALSKMDRSDVQYIHFKTHPSDYQEGKELLLTEEKQRLPVKITGKHNFQNLSAAQETLKKIGITSEMFYQAVPSFEGIRN